MSLRPSMKSEARKSRYKVSIDADEGRKRREDNMVEIRKNKRKDHLLKKRHQPLTQQQQPSQLNSASDNPLEVISAMISGVLSGVPTLQLEGTKYFRKMLSIEHNPPINAVIKTGIVPWLVEFLGRNDLPRLQFEAAWTLTNIASGTSNNTRVLIDLGVVPIFVKLLNSPAEEVREQVVWALGNIAGDSLNFRDLVLAHGALMPLLAQLNKSSKLSLLRKVAWTLSNFCRGKPQSSIYQIKPALLTMERLLRFVDDDEVLANTCWALLYLSDGGKDGVQAIIDAGLCPRLVELLLHPSPSVLVPALRTIGNVVTGDDVQTQYILDLQTTLLRLLNLLTSKYKKIIRKHACWTISNIIAGTVDQIQTVIDAGIISPLVSLLQTGHFEIKKEAAWAISNATSIGTHEQIKFVVSQGCIKPLCDLLICPDPSVVTVCLDGLINILKVGEAEKNSGNTGDVNLYALMIDEVEGLEKIESLQSHDNNEIYKKAVKMLEIYWVEDEDEVDELLLQATSLSGFQFRGNEAPILSGVFNFS